MRWTRPIGVRSDQTGILTAMESVKAYPDPLRRALTIAQVYKPGNHFGAD